ncbi:hypothetical protein HZS_214 [Henneguya salminicola]|nr:hypothetical protein HZS_214 [Henneguya salminicola]
MTPLSLKGLIFQNPSEITENGINRFNNKVVGWPNAFALHSFCEGNYVILMSKLILYICDTQIKIIGLFTTK